MDERLYRAYSATDFVIFIALRCGVAAGWVVLYQEYYRNPPVIGSLLVFLGLIFLILGNAEVIIYRNKLVYQYTSIASVLFGFMRRSWEMGEIREARLGPVQHPVSQWVLIAIWGWLLTTLMNASSSRREFRNIILKLKNDKENEILLEVPERVHQKIVELINAQVFPS